jgi:STE24 endopeptidase
MPRSTVARVGGAAVGMILVAELAVWVLAPAGPSWEPLAAGEERFFAAEALERAREYRNGQRLLGLAGLAIELIALAALALRPPRLARRQLERFERRPIAGAALAGAAISLLLVVATLPTSLAAHERAVDAGISSQELGPWFWDVGRSAVIGALLTALAAALLIALVRRFHGRWWLPGTAVVAALAAVFVWIAPVLLAPVFNDFEPLPAGSATRADVLELADRADVDVGEVLSVDASRRVTSLNAYVDGLGPTKRVVLYDNLLRGAERAELNSVVAHELGHVANRDLPRGLLFIALVAPLGLLFTRELAGALAARAGVDPGSPAALPAYGLALSLALFALNIPGNQLSREVETAADAFALELTDDPQALIDLQLRLARSNLSDPDPPGLAVTVLSTHPPTIDRIGLALGFEAARD